MVQPSVMIVFGFHAIEEILKRRDIRSADNPATLYISKKTSKTERLESLARPAGLGVHHVSDRELDRLCGSDRHRGVVLRLENDPEMVKNDLQTELRKIDRQQALILLLDEITDPQNLGAILRSADQFGVELVVIPKRHSARETGTVLTASSGASAYIPIVTAPSLVQAIEACKKAGFWIYGAHLLGARVDSADLRGKVALVLGSEGRGLRRLVAERCDTLVRIPACGQVDSFNVSVAAGILMYEVRRQQGFWR